MYKSAYQKLLSSPSVKTWFGVKAKLGAKELNVYDEPIPKLEEGNVRILNSEMETTHKECSEHASSIPLSNGSAFFSSSKLKVGIITDDFMYNYYKDALDLVYLSP